MTARDKRGRDLTPGDAIELVYGGDLHHTKVKEIAHEAGSDVVKAQVLATVPAASVRKLGKLEPVPDTTRRRSTHE